jgi:hypothetical protein
VRFRRLWTCAAVALLATSAAASEPRLEADGLSVTPAGDDAAGISAAWRHGELQLFTTGRYGEDPGDGEGGRPSRRYDLELASELKLRPWASLDARVTWTRARFSDESPDGRRVPGAPETVVSAGLRAFDLGPVAAGLRLSYVAPRALAEDDSARSDPTLLLAGRTDLHLDETWTLSFVASSVLHGSHEELHDAYASRLSTTPLISDTGGLEELLVSSSVRIAISATF